MAQGLKYKEVFGKILQSKLPFVLYKKPEEEEVFGLIQKDANMWFVQDFEKDQGFVFAPYQNSEERILIKSDAKMIFDMEDLDITVSVGVNDLLNAGVTPPNFDYLKEEHVDKIKKGIKAVKSGIIDKVVITREELWKANSVDFSAIFKDLVNSYDDAFVYIWFHPLVGMWIGATPEMLLEKDDEYIHSTAIAGTRKAHDNSREWGEKEIKEQKLVTDYVVDIFEKNLLSSVKTYGPETVKAGELEHLKTDVTGELSYSSNINYLVNSLHPTPAVCGVPLDKSKTFISAIEGYERFFYTGFLGELNIENHTEFYVNLRCLQVVKEGVKFFVGGGITEDSNPDSEWEETVNKSKTLKNIVLQHLT